MWVNVSKYADIVYDLRGAKPTKSQLNCIYQALARGSIPGAKHGKHWLIKLEVTNGYEGEG